MANVRFRGVALDECQVGRQRIAKRKLLVPTQAASLEQMQVRCALIVFHVVSDHLAALTPCAVQRVGG